MVILVDQGRPSQGVGSPRATNGHRFRVHTGGHYFRVRYIVTDCAVNEPEDTEELSLDCPLPLNLSRPLEKTYGQCHGHVSGNHETPVASALRRRVERNTCIRSCHKYLSRSCTMK